MSKLDELNEFLATVTVESTPKPKPKAKPRATLVCSSGRIVGSATVVVSPRDPNWYREYWQGFNGTIHVVKPVKPEEVREIGGFRFSGTIIRRV